MGGNVSSQGHQGVALARPHPGEAPAGRRAICSGGAGKLGGGWSQGACGPVLQCAREQDGRRVSSLNMLGARPRAHEWWKRALASTA